jgi:Tfp pilus assembly protein PilN
MVSVNLLSPTVVLARKRARRLRRWVVTVLTTAGVASVPVAFDVIQHTSAAELARRTPPLKTRLAAAKQEIQSLSERFQDLTAQLSRADALRSKRAWAGLLAAVAGQAPEEVWLLDVESIQSSGAAALTGGSRLIAAVTAKPESNVVAIEGPRGIRITGYAMDHELLYEFMSRLKRIEIFSFVEMTNAARENVQEHTAVKFVLECTW